MAGMILAVQSRTVEQMFKVIWQEAPSRHLVTPHVGECIRPLFQNRRTVRNALMCKYVTMGRYTSPQNAPFSGHLDPVHGSLDPHESALNGFSIGSVVFA